MIRKLIAPLLLVLVLGVTTTARPQEPTLSAAAVTAYGTALTSVVVSAAVGNERYLCTIFQLQSYYAWSVVMSAGHCAVVETVWAIRGDKARTLDLVHWYHFNQDVGHDAAFGTSTAPYPNVPNLVIRPSPLNPGEALYTVGYPEGVFAVNHGTYVGPAATSLPDDIIATVTDNFGPGDDLGFGLANMDIPIRGGASGSLVLDSNGYLVGILVYGFDVLGHPELMGFTTVARLMEIVRGERPNSPLERYRHVNRPHMCDVMYCMSL